MLLRLHPDNPQQRLLDLAVATLQKQDSVIIYPTDSVYGLGCDLENRKAIERVYQLKKVDKKKPMSIICPNLSMLSEYVLNVSTNAFRILKRVTPGPYTFIFEASIKIPRIMLSKQRTIGIRIPDNPICQGLLSTLGRPMLSTSLLLDEEYSILQDPEDIYENWGHLVDVVIDGGHLTAQHSTIIDFTSGQPVVIRKGKGETKGIL